jgi:apolipoprotein N-acyltransferase
LKLLRSFWPAPLVAGALMAASFPPLDQGWLMPIAWAVLFASMRLRRGERAGWQTFVAMSILFLPDVSWILPLVWPCWLVVAFWCAGWEAVWGRFVAGRLFAAGERPHAAWIVVLPASHFIVDWVRTFVLSGFPWLLTGYSGWRNPVLLGGADLIGVHGATLAILLLGAGLAEFACRIGEKRERAWRALVPAAVVWAVFAAWTLAKPALVERPGPTVLLLQPNIAQVLKEDAIKSGAARPTTETMWRLHENSAAAGLAEAKAAGRRVDLVVWAETMVPTVAVRPFTDGTPFTTPVRDDSGEGWRRDTANGRRIAAAADGAETLAGTSSIEPVEGSDRPLWFNTVVLLDDAGRLRGHQDKQHLTPGGEYIPLRWLIPFRAQFEAYLEGMIGFLPDLVPGESGHVLTLRDGTKTGVLICYESVYPGISRDMVRSGAAVLVNCSNYAWYAGTCEMQQALAMCAFRSAELHRSLVLSSNNGVSAVIGPDGRVRGEATRADEAAHLVATVPLCETRSPFAAVGEWAAWGIGIAGVAAAFLLQRQAAARRI